MLSQWYLTDRKYKWERMKIMSSRSRLAYEACRWWIVSWHCMIQHFITCIFHMISDLCNVYTSFALNQSIEYVSIDNAEIYEFDDKSTVVDVENKIRMHICISWWLVIFTSIKVNLTLKVFILSFTSFFLHMLYLLNSSVNTFICLSIFMFLYIKSWRMSRLFNTSI